MMIGIMVGIQTICVGFTTYLTFKSAKRSVELKLVNKDKTSGFKHFKTGRF
jgi:hypothetical protein